jgi:hypothetical protein
LSPGPGPMSGEEPWGIRLPAAGILVNAG